MNVFYKTFIIYGAILGMCTNANASNSDIGNTKLDFNISNYGKSYQVARSQWLPDFYHEGFNFPSQCDRNYYTLTKLPADSPNLTCSECRDSNTKGIYYHCECPKEYFYDITNCKGDLGGSQCLGKYTSCEPCTKEQYYDETTHSCKCPDKYRYDHSNCSGILSVANGSNPCKGLYTECTPCETNEIYDAKQNICTCPDKYKYDSLTCIGGTLGANKCQGKSDVCNCPPNQHLENDQCVKDILDEPTPEPTPDCGPEYKYDQTNCSGTLGGIPCGKGNMRKWKHCCLNGQTYDSTTDKCVKLCYPGEVFSPVTQTCVPLCGKNGTHNEVYWGQAGQDLCCYCHFDPNGKGLVHPIPDGYERNINVNLGCGTGSYAICLKPTCNKDFKFDRSNCDYVLGGGTCGNKFRTCTPCSEGEIYKSDTNTCEVDLDCNASKYPYDSSNCSKSKNEQLFGQLCTTKEGVKRATMCSCVRGFHRENSSCIMDTDSKIDKGPGGLIGGQNGPRGQAGVINSENVTGTGNLGTADIPNQEGAGIKPHTDPKGGFSNPTLL